MRYILEPYTEHVDKKSIPETSYNIAFGRQKSAIDGLSRSPTNKFDGTFIHQTKKGCHSPSRFGGHSCQTAGAV